MKSAKEHHDALQSGVPLKKALWKEVQEFGF